MLLLPNTVLAACNIVEVGAPRALLLASVAWGLGTVLAYHLKLPHGPDALCVQYVGGTVWLVGLAQQRLEHVPVMPSFSSTLALVYLILGCSVLGYAVHAYLVRHASPAWASSYVYVTPAVALLLQGLLGS